MIFGSNTSDSNILAEGEYVVKQAKISKASLLISWCSVPALLLIIYFPRIIQRIFFGIVLDAVGVGGSSFISVLLTIPIVILCIVWLGICVVMTKRYFNYQLAITNFRVIGKAGNDDLDAPLSNVVNVFLEQPLLGRLFHYGSITVYTKRKSITVKNLCDPEEIYKILIAQAEENSVQI